MIKRVNSPSGFSSQQGVGVAKTLTQEQLLPSHVVSSWYRATELSFCRRIPAFSTVADPMIWKRLY